MAAARGRRHARRRGVGKDLPTGWGWHHACFSDGCGNSHDRLATSWNGPLRAAALAWRNEPATILDRAGQTGLTRCFMQTGPADFHSPPGFSFGEFQVFSFKFQGNGPRKRWGETPFEPFLGAGIGIGIEAGWDSIPMAIPTPTLMGTWLQT